jgi:hypothetical protein
MKTLSRLMLPSVFALLGLILLAGCGSPPVAVEQHFYTITTNETPIVTSAVTFQAVTNGPVVTFTTNVVYTTNLQVGYVFTPNTTNAAPVVGIARGIGNIFGPYGDLIAAAIIGALALWGKVRSTQATQADAASAVLAQGIETLREILKTTPQGREMDTQIVALLSKQQITAGVIREVARIVNDNVDNPAAKQAARALLERLPQS